MNRRQWILPVLGCLLAVTLVSRVKANAEDEITRLAALMGWKPGTTVADIGAGDGSYTFAAVKEVTPSSRVFATEIDSKKIMELRAEVQKRNLRNVTVVEGSETDTKLPTACCDAIFLRRVYHHLTKPVEFNVNLLRSLKPGGRLAIIDFPPRTGLAPVEGVPSNRGGHGIRQEVAIEEITAAGLQVEKILDDWPEDSYCVIFVKK